ncbi:hypothetical protein [Reyranella sp.]|uniref:hypothetical protein n=1 Tax=Reyranella sp. TaxID=1929291 RepID=UPI003D0C856F
MAWRKGASVEQPGLRKALLRLMVAARALAPFIVVLRYGRIALTVWFVEVVADVHAR